MELSGRCLGEAVTDNANLRQVSVVLNQLAPAHLDSMPTASSILYNIFSYTARNKRLFPGRAYWTITNRILQYGVSQYSAGIISVLPR